MVKHQPTNVSLPSRRARAAVCGLGGLCMVALALLLAFAGAVPQVWAQEWLFTLDRNISRVTINRDGSADIEYWLTYTNAPGAHALDIIDVGLPNSTYDLNTAQAWFSRGTGQGPESALTDIRKSEVVQTGVEVHMGQFTIQPNEQGTLHLKINVKQMVYPDSEDENRASVEFAPHYYDSENVRGQTYMEIQIAFPPGVSNEETVYHNDPFDEVDQVNDRIVFIWVYPNATGSETHKQGVSFPRSYVDEVYKPPVLIGGGQGGILSDVDWGTCGCIGLFALIFGGGAVLSSVQGKKRKMAYLPPSLSVEGVGIKRGLTAIEAAILLEKPLNKVLTMVLFGLLKKQAIVVQSEDPLRINKVEPLPERQYHDYEQRFLAAIKPDGALDQKELQEVVVEIVQSVNKKMKGFSRKETVTYYQSIVDRAWEQVSSEATPEVKSRQFDQGLEWMMMDDTFEDRTRRTFTSGPVFMPPWWTHYRPWVPAVRSARSDSSGPSPTPAASGGGREINLPTLPGAAFAGTLVSGMERTAGGIVNRLEAFTGGVTQKTNPPPVSSSTGSSHRSGGCACACACACAGCACACAGGGR